MWLYLDMLIRDGKPAVTLAPALNGTPLSWFVLQSRHAVVILGNIAHCSRCLHCCAAGLPAMRRWMMTPCEGESSVLRRSVVDAGKSCEVGNVVVTVGNYTQHHSHSLYVFRKLYFCIRCGFVASTRPWALADPCCNTLKYSRGRVVAAIRAGARPWGMMAWPDEKPLSGFAVSLQL